MNAGDDVWVAARGGEWVQRFVLLSVAGDRACVAWPTTLAVAGFYPLSDLHPTEAAARAAAKGGGG